MNCREQAKTNCNDVHVEFQWINNLVYKLLSCVQWPIHHLSDLIRSYHLLSPGLVRHQCSYFAFNSVYEPLANKLHIVFSSLIIETWDRPWSRISNLESRPKVATLSHSTLSLLSTQPSPILSPLHYKLGTYNYISCHVSITQSSKWEKNISCMVYVAMYRKTILLKAKNWYSYSKAALLYGACPWHSTKSDFMYEKSYVKRK